MHKASRSREKFQHPQLLAFSTKRRSAIVLSQYRAKRKFINFKRLIEKLRREVALERIEAKIFSVD